MNHTKGPWQWDIRCNPNNPSRFTNREHSYLYDAKGNCLLEVTPECLPSNANAQLIAVAPEMLEAIEFMLKELRIDNDQTGLGKQRLQDVIRKVWGEK